MKHHNEHHCQCEKCGATFLIINARYHRCSARREEGADNEESILDKWKKVCESLKKIEFTDEERRLLQQMLDANKRAKDPEYWKGIVFTGMWVCQDEGGAE